MDTKAAFPNYEIVDKILAGIFFCLGYGFVYLFLGATNVWSFSIFTIIGKNLFQLQTLTQRDA